MQETINEGILLSVVLIILVVLMITMIRAFLDTFTGDYKKNVSDVGNKVNTENVVKYDTIKCTNCSVLYDSEDSFCAFCGIKRGETN